MRILGMGFLMLQLLMLSACADTEWPQWLSGEPTRAEMNAYQGPIAMPQTDVSGKAWPNLADVPQRPAILLTDADKAKLVSEMKQKNEEGLAEIAAYNAKQEALNRAVLAKQMKAKKAEPKKTKSNKATAKKRKRKNK